MGKTSTILVLTALLLGRFVQADEQTRQVQEELRKRHLFFSDIDGRASLEYAAALKSYQQRKGFAVTGTADDMTLYSLGIGEPASPAEGGTELPDVPVLRSDIAPRGRTPSSAPLAIAGKGGEIPRAEMRQFIRRYLDACASPNPQDELGFYADRVDYFDHGMVDRSYVQNELAVYNQRWPSRKYSMGDSIRLGRLRGGATARFRLAFQVANPDQRRRASGRADDTIAVVKRPDSNLQIVAIKETRVRKPSRHRRKPPSPGAAVARTVHKIFRSIFR